MPTIIPLDFEKEIREFRGQLQALKLPPINRSNGFENFFKREDKLQENLKLLDITTTSKRHKLSRQKIKKKAKNVEAEVSSKVEKAHCKKSEKAQSARRISGEITKSFLVISSLSGSRYTLIKHKHQREALGAIMGKKHMTHMMEVKMK